MIFIFDFISLIQSNYVTFTKAIYYIPFENKIKLCKGFITQALQVRIMMTNSISFLVQGSQ